MNIGIPREIKTLEGRIALTPYACEDLVRAGHDVLIETGAGDASGFSDAAYREAGCRISRTADTLFRNAELIVKVKEPQPIEVERLTAKHTLFCYLHLAAGPQLAQGLCESGCCAIAFETVTGPDGSLPLLAPMSKIAGKLAVDMGATLLHRVNGGAGVMLGGLEAADRGQVVVLGAGNAGMAAARMAAAHGANVVVFDRLVSKLDAARTIGANVTALYPYEHALADAVAAADLLVGAVLVPGGRAPVVVGTDMVKTMRRGSVIVDIAVDQGGCIETIHPTTYEQPTYERHGVTHFGVANMPGAVPRTASQALSAAIAPFVERLTRPGWRELKGFQDGINVDAGNIVHPALLESLTRQGQAREGE